MVGEQQGYVVEAVVDHKVMPGARKSNSEKVAKYKIRWKSRGKEKYDDSWEDVENCHCQWAIDQYWKEWTAAYKRKSDRSLAKPSSTGQSENGTTQQSIYDGYIRAGEVPSSSLWERALAEYSQQSGSRKRSRLATGAYTES